MKQHENNHNGATPDAVSNADEEVKLTVHDKILGAIPTLESIMLKLELNLDGMDDDEEYQSSLYLYHRLRDLLLTMQSEERVFSIRERVLAGAELTPLT